MAVRRADGAPRIARLDGRIGASEGGLLSGQRETEPGDVVDVQALMADLEQRVAEKKARGLYGVDALAIDAAQGVDPFGLEELERLRDGAVVSVPLGVTGSTKAVVGPAVSQAKRALVRGTSQPLLAIAGQVTTFHGALLGYLATLGREVAELRRQNDALMAALGDAGGELPVATRLRELNRAHAATALRLARLEHADGPAAGDAPPVAPPATEPLVRLLAAAPVDGDPERWAAYGELLGDRALHVGAGAGEVLAALGPGAEGVEAGGELVAVARREGRPVHHADPVAYVGALAPGSVSGALVSDLVERLDGDRLAALAVALRRVLAPGGRLVVEGVDPRAPAALSEDAWADVWRLRPVHPEGVRRLLEAAGFAGVRVDGGGGGVTRYAVHATR